ncbi:autotransporter domain-containing protein [Bordetella sp. N]|uniref:autotransporter outer membrane beta-barrel domain-containing protein n=1 Tax=Bordetella sp. N TaxID=1746199 RepID=UPI000708E9A8|nr:autotransporter domain-containing protein [Bordetella sp. N]ALM86161.1 hypothetical protein ASB57_27280 [Bordetella sp. N]
MIPTPFRRVTGPGAVFAFSQIAMAVSLLFTGAPAHAAYECEDAVDGQSFSGAHGCIDWTVGSLTITNTGTITSGADDNGTGAKYATSVGTLWNQGTITSLSSVYDTLVIGLGSAAAEILNDGLISGVSPVRVVGSVTLLTNSATGTITGSGDYGILNDGRFGSPTPAQISTLTNAGLISSTGVAAVGNVNVAYDGVTGVVTIGTIDNQASGTISGEGVVTGASGVLNSGTVVVLNNDGQIRGGYAGVSNSGLISTITNTGTIQGTGAIDNNARGIYNAGTIGSISNNGGLIQGMDTGIYVDGGSISTIDNAGVIRSMDGSSGLYQAGLFVTRSGNVGTLTNSGTIRGLYDSIYVSGSSSLSTIVNTGTIAGDITDASTAGLTINGGSLSNAGLLTGAGGGTGVADKGTIYNVASNLTFGTGFLVLNDDLNVGASGTVYNTGATLGLINPIDVTGNYTQTGGALVFAASSPGSYAYLNVSGNVAISDSTIAISGNSLAPGMSFSLVRAGGTGTYTNLSAFLSTNDGLLAQIATVQGNLVLTLAPDAEHHYWDGGNTAATGTIAGGSGTWTATGTNWTSTDGTSNGVLSSTDVRPVFGGTAGTVTVDTTQGAIDVAGMQFSTDGYRLTGGSIGLTAAASAFEVDDNVTATIDSVLSGTGGLAKTGNGMLILNGVNTYAGGTTVDAGTLEIGDADHATASILGDVTVNSAGTLRGHGTIDGSVVNNGTVRPGGSIGTLTITGDYTQTASGTLYIDVSPTAASQLSVGGTATLGGTLNVLYGPGTYSAATYRIINAASTTGTFSSVVSNAPASLAQSVQSLADGSELTLAAATDTSGSGATDTGGATSGGGVVVVKPTNATVFGAVGSAAIREGQRVNETLLARLGNVPVAGSSGVTGGGNNQVWTQLVSNTNHVRGNNDAPSYKDSHYGFLAGLDHRIGDWTVGVAGGYSHIDVREDQASGKIDTVRVAGYGARYMGPVNVAATVGAAYDFLDTRRGFGPLGDAKGDTDGQEFTAGLQASLPLATGPVIVTPRVGLRYQYFHAGRYGEDGPTSQNLDVDTQNLHSLQPYAQFAVGLPFNTGGVKPALAEVRVGYAYETLDRGRGVDAAAGDGTRFALPGAASSRGMLSAGLGLTMPVGKSVDVTASYDRLFKTGNTSAQAFQLQATYRF